MTQPEGGCCSPLRTSLAERTLPKQTLLVVDADPRSLRILEVALRKAGFAVVTAADGGEALRRLQRSPPDLLLCELSLPAQDGQSLCRAVRADERLAGLPVLLMNADRSPGTVSTSAVRSMPSRWATTAELALCAGTRIAGSSSMVST